MKTYIKIATLLGVLLFALASGCSSPDKPLDESPVASEQEAQRTVAPTNEVNAFTVTNETSQIASTVDLTDVAQVLQVTARHYVGVDGAPSLYAAIEFFNSSDSPIIIKECTVEFDIGGTKVRETFVPMLFEQDIVMGKTNSNLALWVPYSKEVKGDITAKVTLVASQCQLAKLQKIDVEDVQIVQNYPAFSTVSGKVKNNTERDYSLSVVYLSFYDSQDKLLATWHFTKNLSIPSGESRNFVVHMQSLPVKDLAFSTAKIVARGLGIV